MIIVGMDLRIRRFSAAAEKLLSLIAADVGRPITYLVNIAKVPRIEQLVADAIHGRLLKEQRVRFTDGHWYTMRVVPCRTADHTTRGAIIELVKAALRRPSGSGASGP